MKLFNAFHGMCTITVKICVNVKHPLQKHSTARQQTNKKTPPKQHLPYIYSDTPKQANLSHNQSVCYMDKRCIFREDWLMN